MKMGYIQHPVRANIHTISNQKGHGIQSINVANLTHYNSNQRCQEFLHVANLFANRNYSFKAHLI